VKAMIRLAELATEGRAALFERDHRTFASLMNENFDLRRRIMCISEQDLAMVDVARGLGASAKLTGSGGAILGVVEDESMREGIRRELGAMGAVVLTPVVA
jgi:glucuronokinase